jgi:hypothetical protein
MTVAINIAKVNFAKWRRDKADGVNLPSIHFLLYDTPRGNPCRRRCADVSIDERLQNVVIKGKDIVLTPMLAQVDIPTSGLCSGLEFDICISGKKLSEDKLKTSAQRAIALPQARSGV